MMRVYDSHDYYFSGGKQTEMFYGYPDYTKLQKHLYFVADELMRPVRNIAPGKLLDVGCGMGFMLKRFQELGWESYGVDISSYATEYARSELGLNAYTGTIDKIEFPESYFDLVTMVLTVEHMPDPKNALETLHRLMKPDAIIIIATHDIDGLWPKISKSKWQHLFVPEHLFFFSHATLKRLLKEVGFDIFKTTETATLASVTGDGHGLQTPIRLIHEHNLERIAVPILRGFHVVARQLNLSDEVTIYAVKH
jgi:ubiquinone/menaquinone biosynthesis C-methylase UbiE